MLDLPRSWWLCLALTCAWGACDKSPPPTIASKRAAAASAPIGAGKTQLVTVLSEQWNQFRAELRRYERVPGERWKPVGPPIDVVLGREGYAWGRGLHGSGAPKGRPGPIKREGDGRSPAGVFNVGPAYGYASAHEEISLPYRKATPDLRCVDDPQSTHYNQIVSTDDTEVDWRSAEHMHRDDDLYVLAIVIEHNTEATSVGAGSCIFIHLWQGPDKGMSGCTAMSMNALEELASWLQSGAAALVALPRSEYEALKRPWNLPVIPLPGQLGRASDERRVRELD